MMAEAMVENLVGSMVEGMVAMMADQLVALTELLSVEWMDERWVDWWVE
jgi:hypothetical protein